MFTVVVRRVADVSSNMYAFVKSECSRQLGPGGAADRGASDQMRGREASIHDVQIEAADRKLWPFLDQIST